MLIAQEKLAAPMFTSILLVGPAGEGKSASIGTLHRVLRLRKLSTKIAYFDFDQDGAEPVLRLARAGYESIPDMIAKRNQIAPWIDDIMLFRYDTKRRKFNEGQVTPHRDRGLVDEFIRDFNSLDDRIDYNTKQWKAGQEIGAIILDPLTQVQNIYEDFVWTIRNKEIGASGTNAVSFVDWGLLGEKIRDVYMIAKVFPCYLVATAHLDQRLEDVRVPEGQPKLTTGKWYYAPMLVKAVATQIQKDFGITLYTTPDFKWRTKNDEHYRGARSRGKDNLPPIIEQDFREVLDV